MQHLFVTITRLARLMMCDDEPAPEPQRIGKGERDAKEEKRKFDARPARAGDVVAGFGP
jgi:hypothetical protein